MEDFFPMDPSLVDVVDDDDVVGFVLIVVVVVVVMVDVADEMNVDDE